MFRFTVLWRPENCPLGQFFFSFFLSLGGLFCFITQSASINTVVAASAAAPVAFVCLGKKGSGGRITQGYEFVSVRSWSAHHSSGEQVFPETKGEFR